MQAYLFIAAFIAVLAVIFALQNAVPVTVSFIIWRVESSLALILIITFIAGLATSFLFNTLTRIRRTRSDSDQKKKKNEQTKQESPEDN
ncbi:MAG TPA: LapA family protein [Atribacterota bacterium]|nr:LapA family protein [Atribacterota bacterium]